MTPQGRPAARELGRRLDLANDGVEVLQKERPVLCGHKLPALQKPLLKPREPLHLRGGDAVRPRHPHQLHGVRSRLAPELPASVPPPIQQPPSREERADAERYCQRPRLGRDQQASQTRHRAKRHEAQEATVYAARPPPGYRSAHAPTSSRPALRSSSRSTGALSGGTSSGALVSSPPSREAGRGPLLNPLISPPRPAPRRFWNPLAAAGL